MTMSVPDIHELIAIRHRIKQEKPLIHCITNHISINDCANAVLAVGAKPIMAEHPLEVAAITASAQALAVNLGNISDIRMEAIMVSGKTAHAKSIPAIIDIVGVACSPLRLAFAQKFIAESHPAVIKGNMSELKTLCGLPSATKGIDAGEQDALTTDSMTDTSAMLSTLAIKTGAVVAATGATDMIADGKTVFLIKNGSEMLPLLTGTGCMLNVLTAAFLSSRKPLAATLLATALMGICGEISEDAQGPASFKNNLWDSLYNLSDETFSARIKYMIL